MKIKLNEAVQLFQKELLKTQSAPYIMKIIHFGSTLKGETTPQSDIDLLVVSSDGETVKDAVANVTFSLQMNYGIPLEPIIENLDEYVFPTTYFLYNILNYGKEVYSVDKDELKKEAGINLIHLAEEYLKGAEESKQNGYLRIAIDTGYNAAELGVKSLLLKKIDDLPGSHGGLVGRFGELYVKTGEFTQDIGRKLNRALELRNSARYKYQAIIREEDADFVLDLAEALIKEAAKK